MSEPAQIPMPPSYYDPVTGTGPTVVAADRCPRGHRHGPAVRWHVIPVRPGDPVHHWRCYACVSDGGIAGVEFWASLELYDVDPATWYWGPYQVRRRQDFAETMRRIAEHRAKHFAGG